MDPLIESGLTVQRSGASSIFGEGPQQESAAELTAQGFNEGKGKPYSSEDIRFATKGSKVYATVMDWPDSGKAVIKSLGTVSAYHPEKINCVKLVSTGASLKFERTPKGLEVYFPQEKPQAAYANALEIV